MTKQEGFYFQRQTPDTRFIPESEPFLSFIVLENSKDKYEEAEIDRHKDR